jgi:RHS repeat-associated protein
MSGLVNYDSVNRLAAAFDTGGWAQNFSFDRYGNPWTTANVGLPPDRLPTSNVYTATTNRSAYAGTGYDSGGVGNQVTMGSTQVTFDAENWIVQAYDTTALNSTCFGYDGLGERVYKQTFGGNTCTGTAATTVIYVYDAFGNLMRQVETVTGSGTLPLTPCLTCYVTWDHLGSVRMVSDTISGGFTAFHDYAPFGGEVLNNAGRTSDWGNGTDYLSQRYTGAERDKETTLDFLQARYLANLQARFMSPDPAGNAGADPTNPQSWNMYSYARNNPLKYVDPTGLCSRDINGNLFDDDNIDDEGGAFVFSGPCSGGVVGDPDAAANNGPDPNNPAIEGNTVSAQEDSGLTYFFSDLAGYTQPNLAQNQIFNPALSVYVKPGTAPPFSAQKSRPSWATCLFAPHDFNQAVYAGPQMPGDPLLEPIQ